MSSVSIDVDCQLSRQKESLATNCPVTGNRFPWEHTTHRTIVACGNTKQRNTLTGTSMVIKETMIVILKVVV